MRRILVGIVLICIAYMASGQVVPTLETSISLGKLGYSRLRSSDDVTYTGAILFSGKAGITYPLSDVLIIKGALAADPILKESLSAFIGYWRPSLQVVGGPVIGISALDASAFNAGLAAELHAEIADRIYFEASGAYGFGFGGVRRGEAAGEFGWYLPFAVASLDWSWESFTGPATPSPVLDRRTWYGISMEVFQKYVPYLLKLGLGYQLVEKTFSPEGAGIEHTLHSLIFVTDVSVPIRGFMSASIALQSSVFTFGVADDTFLSIPSTGLNAYLFDVTLSARVELPF